MQTQKEIIKYDTINAVRLTGTAPGTYEFSVQLDNDYDEVIGIEAYENSGSAQAYKIGIKDNVKVHFQPTNKGALLTTSGVAQKDKSRPINFDIKDGRKTTVQLVFAAVTTANVDIDVVFKLAKRLQKN